MAPRMILNNMQSPANGRKTPDEQELFSHSSLAYLAADVRLDLIHEIVVKTTR